MKISIYLVNFKVEILPLTRQWVAWDKIQILRADFLKMSKYSIIQPTVQKFLALANKK